MSKNQKPRKVENLKKFKQQKLKLLMSKNQKPKKVESLQTHKSKGSMKITFSGSHAIQAPLSSWIEEQFLGLRGREIKKKKNYSITLVNQIDAITVCGSNDSVLLILRCYDLNLSSPTIFLTQQSESFKLFPQTQ